MGVKLTENEKRVLRGLREMERKHINPTYRAMAEYLGFKSIGTVFQFIGQLERKGYLAEGTRLAEVPCQVVTGAGRKLLSREAA